MLTHCSLVMSYGIIYLVIIGLCNGLSPFDTKPLLDWTNADYLWAGPLRNIYEIWRDIQSFCFKKIHFKMLFAKWQPFCPDPKVSVKVVPGVLDFIALKRWYCLCLGLWYENWVTLDNLLVPWIMLGSAIQWKCVLMIGYGRYLMKH